MVMFGRLAVAHDGELHARLRDTVRVEDLLDADGAPLSARKGNGLRCMYKPSHAAPPPAAAAEDDGAAKRGDELERARRAFARRHSHLEVPREEPLPRPAPLVREELRAVDAGGLFLEAVAAAAAVG